jgi:hypothetical protein
MIDRMRRNVGCRSRRERRYRTRSRRDGAGVALDVPAREDAQASRAGFVALTARTLQDLSIREYDFNEFKRLLRP